MNARKQLFIDVESRVDVQAESDGAWHRLLQAWSRHRYDRVPLPAGAVGDLETVNRNMRGWAVFPTSPGFDEAIYYQLTFLLKPMKRTPGARATKPGTNATRSVLGSIGGRGLSEIRSGGCDETRF